MVRQEQRTNSSKVFRAHGLAFGFKVKQNVTDKSYVDRCRRPISHYQQALCASGTFSLLWSGVKEER
jgi:hypothetical protein